MICLPSPVFMANKARADKTPAPASLPPEATTVQGQASPKTVPKPVAPSGYGAQQPGFLIAPSQGAVQLRCAMFMQCHILLRAFYQFMSALGVVQHVCWVDEEPCHWTWYLEANKAKHWVLFLAQGSAMPTTALILSRCSCPTKLIVPGCDRHLFRTLSSFLARGFEQFGFCTC